MMAFYCLGAECFITLYVIPCEQCSTWAMPSFISHGGSVEARTMKHELFQNRISKVHKVFFFYNCLKFNAELFDYYSKRIND